MESPVTVKFRWSADDLYQGCCNHWRQDCRRVIRALMSATIYTIAALSAVGGIVAYRAGDSWTACLILPFLGLCGLCWWFRSSWHRRLVWRQFAKRPDKDIEVEWQLSPDKVVMRSCRGYSEIDWQSFIKVVRAPSGLMLYSLENMFNYLPRRGFASDSEFEQATALAKSKVPKFRCVT